MALFIDRVHGYEATAFSDLLEIVSCDPGLTTSPVSLFALKVSYTQKKGATAASTRILDLVNDPGEFVVAAVDSGFIVPESYQSIMKFAGGVTQLPTLSQALTVYYDVTDAGGQYYSVYDVNRQQIFSPQQVALYHELSHVYHYLKKDIPTDFDKREIQAVVDENAYRSSLGLPQRHPTDHWGGPAKPTHGGVTFPACQKKDTGWTPNWKLDDCFTAVALGTMYEDQADELRRARAKYRAVSSWAARIAEPALDLYAQFSPGIARDLYSDAALRTAVQRYAAQPAFYLLQIAETYLGADGDTAEVDATVNGWLREYVASLDAVGGSAALAMAADGASIGSWMLASANTGVYGSASRELPRDLFPYLARAILSTGVGAPVFAWAFEGLALFLRHAAASHRTGARLDASFVSALAAWTVQVPLPIAQATLSAAEEELHVLGTKVFTRPETRERFAHGLLAQWPESTTPELHRILLDRGYLKLPRQG